MAETRGLKFILLVLVLVFVSLRLCVLFQFSFEYTDNDQTILWYAARELSHGLFHEPCFYGQAYNTWTESLLAVPMIWMGVPFEQALPIITSCLFTTSLLLLTDVLRKYSVVRAIVFLCLLLSLPLDFHFVTSVTRGWVTGIASVSLGIWILHRVQGIRRFAFAGFFLALGFFINPNSVLLLVFALEPASLKELKLAANRRALFWGFVVGSLPLLYSLLFYGVLHPEYVAHRFNFFQFGFRTYRWNLARFARDYREISFFGWVRTTITLFILGWILSWKSLEARWAHLYVFLAVAIYLGSAKAKSVAGTYTPVSRSLLCFPLFVASNFSKIWIDLKIGIRPAMVALGVLSLTVVLNSGYELNILDKRIRSFVTRGFASYWKVSAVKEGCDQIAQLTTGDPSELVVFGARYSIEAYGCPALYPQMQSLQTGIDRRTWLIEAEKNTNRSSFLFVRGTATQEMALKNAGLNLEPIVDRIYRIKVLPARSVVDVLADAGIFLRQ